MYAVAMWLSGATVLLSAALVADGQPAQRVDGRLPDPPAAER